MKKSRLEISLEPPKPPKRIGLRGALFLALACLSGGAVAGYESGKNQAEKGSATVSAILPDENSEEGDGGRKIRRKRSLISSEEFDKDPLAYVDVSRCRELVLRWDGQVISEDEIVGKAREIEILREEAEREGREREKAANADKIIADLCLKNPADIEKVRRAVDSARARLTEIIYKKGKWSVRVQDPNIAEIDGSSMDWGRTDLAEEPPCKPNGVPFKFDQAKEEERKRMLDLIGEKNYGKAMGGIDFDRFGQEAAREKVEKEVAETVSAFKRFSDYLDNSGNGDPVGRKQALCKLAINFFIADKAIVDGERLVTIPAEQLQRIKGNPILSGELDKMYDLVMEVMAKEGVKDVEEECIMAMIKGK